MNRKIPRDDEPAEFVPTCAYCGSNVGVVQLIALGRPGHIDVHNAYLHADCERAYLRMIIDPETT